MIDLNNTTQYQPSHIEKDGQKDASIKLDIHCPQSRPGRCGEEKHSSPCPVSNPRSSSPFIQDFNAVYIGTIFYSKSSSVLSAQA